MPRGALSGDRPPRPPDASRVGRPCCIAGPRPPVMVSVGGVGNDDPAWRPRRASAGCDWLPSGSRVAISAARPRLFDGCWPCRRRTCPGRNGPSDCGRPERPWLTSMTRSPTATSSAPGRCAARCIWSPPRTSAGCWSSPQPEPCSPWPGGTANWISTKQPSTRAGEVAVGVLEGGRAATRADLFELLEKDGIATAGQRAPHMLGRLRQNRTLCLGPMRGNTRRWC